MLLSTQKYILQNKLLLVRRLKLIYLVTLSKAWICGRSLTRVAGPNSAGTWIIVYCEYYVLSGRSYCVRLNTRPEKSY
jgi:hypothetical protein